MSEAPEPAAIPRRRALSLLGLAGALGLAAPRLLLAAASQAVTPAFAQADKPLPGEGGRARTAPEGDKPILGEGTRAHRRRVRRRRVQERRVARRKRRIAPTEAPPPASGDRPK